MVPNSNSTVLPSGGKGPRTTLSAGMLFLFSSLMAIASLSPAELWLRSRLRGDVRSGLLELRGSHGMRSGNFVTQFVACGVHGLATNGRGYSGFHHHFSETPRSLVESQSRI